MKTFSAIVQENTIKGAKFGYHTGRSIGGLLGITFGAAAGGAIGAGHGAVRKAAVYADTATLRKLDKVAVWIRDQVNAGHPIPALREKFAEEFSGFKSNTRNPVGKGRYEAEIRWFNDHVLRLADMVDDIEARQREGDTTYNPFGKDSGYPSIRAHTWNGVKKGANIGATAFGVPLGLAGGAAGAYLGTAWQLAKVIAKLIGLGAAKGEELQKIAWITDSLNKADMSGLYTDINSIKKAFVDKFADGPNSSPSMKTYQATKQKESDWFDKHFNDIYDQYEGLKVSERRYEDKKRNKEQKRNARTAEQNSGASNFHYTPDDHEQSTSLTTTHRRLGENMKSYKEIAEMNHGEESSGLDQLFEQFLEKGVEMSIEEGEDDEINEAAFGDTMSKKVAKEWIIDQIENTQDPHDVIKKKFLDMYKDPAKRAMAEKFFDKVVSRHVD